MKYTIIRIKETFWKIFAFISLAVFWYAAAIFFSVLHYSNNINELIYNYKTLLFSLIGVY